MTLLDFFFSECFCFLSTPLVWNLRFAFACLSRQLNFVDSLTITLTHLVSKNSYWHIRRKLTVFACKRRLWNVCATLIGNKSIKKWSAPIIWILERIFFVTENLWLLTKKFSVLCTLIMFAIYVTNFHNWQNSADEL